MGEELWAAVELDSGAAIADPFRPSGELVELLRFRAERIRGGAGPSATAGRRCSPARPEATGSDPARGDPPPRPGVRPRAPPIPPPRNCRVRSPDP